MICWFKLRLTIHLVFLAFNVKTKKLDIVDCLMKIFRANKSYSKIKIGQLYGDKQNKKCKR